MKHFQNLVVALLFLGSFTPSVAQTNDATTPLHLMKPDYPTPYIVPQKEDIKTVLDRVYTFLDKNSASKIVNATTKVEITNYKKSNEEALSLGKTKILLVKYLAKDNVGIAIDFLEQNNEEDEILLNLYKITNQPLKAYDLLDRLYKKSNNLDFLAQQAIIQFEMAEDQSKVLNDVIFKFDKVLLVTNNHIYENYLAYILIDFNINVKRGVSLVKKALKEEPNNLAYIDTLAWGEYKLKNCQEANKQMKRVVDEIGLNDEEIKLHWEKIKECKK